MTKITLLLFTFFSGICFLHISNTYAQQVTTPNKGHIPDASIVTGVIFSVDPKSNGINGIYLREQDEEAQLYKLKSDCYRCEYYQGSIEGSFTLTNHGINPGKNAILTIYKVHNLMPGRRFDPGPVKEGSKFTLARIKSTVIENQNENFRFKIN